jgi:CBS domain containing-hemolysin-like protein
LAVFPDLTGPLDRPSKQMIFNSYRRGIAVNALAKRFRRTRTSIYRAINEMRARRMLLAFVVDEQGGMEGIVTMEDLLEELVGDISDEYDREEVRIEELADGAVRVNGRVSIDDVNEALDVKLPQDEWDTIGGLMLSLAGEIPEEGQTVRFENLRLKAEKVVGRRIKSVLITRDQPEPPAPEDAGKSEGAERS